MFELDRALILLVDMVSECPVFLIALSNSAVPHNQLKLTQSSQLGHVLALPQWLR